jgi:hypothetical protein
MVAYQADSLHPLPKEAAAVECAGFNVDMVALQLLGENVPTAAATPCAAAATLLAARGGAMRLGCHPFCPDLKWHTLDEALHVETAAAVVPNNAAAGENARELGVPLATLYASARKLGTSNSAGKSSTGLQKRGFCLRKWRSFLLV